MSLNVLGKSWDAFSPKRAKEYLRSFGHPSIGSKKLLTDVLKELNLGEVPSIIDLGCGNAQLLEYFQEQKFSCVYAGVDVSDSLLCVAKEMFPNTQFIYDDVDTLEKVTDKYDIAVYSHVLEIIASPESSLLRAQQFAKKIAIRFFEPPEFEFDTVELREMEVGDGKMAPYIRRKMSKDYYRLILAKMNCTRVDVYQDQSSKDQVHILHY